MKPQRKNIKYICIHCNTEAKLNEVGEAVHASTGNYCCKLSCDLRHTTVATIRTV